MNGFMKFGLYGIVAPTVIKFVVVGVLATSVVTASPQDRGATVEYGVTQTGAVIYKQCEAATPLNSQSSNAAEGAYDGCVCFTRGKALGRGYDDILGSTDKLAETMNATLSAMDAKDKSEQLRQIEQMHSSLAGYAQIAAQQSLPAKTYIDCPQ